MTEHKRLTTKEKHPHGAEGVSKDKLTGKYCRGVFEATACVEKLAEYETAEEEGRLLFLPCNPGITLYILRKKYTKCSKHNEEFDESLCCGCEDECDSRLFYYIVPCPDVTAEQILEFERLGALNKKIFFSKEEAEKALKEMEGK